jgi:hypothetical protein
MGGAVRHRDQRDGERYGEHGGVRTTHGEAPTVCCAAQQMPAADPLSMS